MPRMLMSSVSKTLPRMMPAVLIELDHAIMSRYIVMMSCSLPWLSNRFVVSIVVKTTTPPIFKTEPPALQEDDDGFKLHRQQAQGRCLSASMTAQAAAGKLGRDRAGARRRDGN